MGKYDCLFEPLRVGSLQLKNRIVLEPMGIHSHRLVNEDGSFTEDGITFYETIAKGGTGLIITSAMPVNSTFDLAKGSKASMDLAGEAFVENTKSFTQRIHQYGAKVFMQLSAGAGRVQPRFIADGEPIAPSDGLPNFWNPSILHRALTKEEIEQYIRCFGQAARKAKKGGVDGVEIQLCTKGICWINSPWHSATSEPMNMAGAWKVVFCLPKGLWKRSRSPVGKIILFPFATVCVP